VFIRTLGWPLAHAAKGKLDVDGRCFRKSGISGYIFGGAGPFPERVLKLRIQEL